MDLLVENCQSEIFLEEPSWLPVLLLHCTQFSGHLRKVVKPLCYSLLDLLDHILRYGLYLKVSQQNVFYKACFKLLLFPQQSEKQKACKSSLKHFHLPALEGRGGGYWPPCKVFGVWGRAQLCSERDQIMLLLLETYKEQQCLILCFPDDV